MDKTEQELIAEIPNGTIMFKSSVKGDLEDNFSVPFGIIKTAETYYGFIEILENCRYYNMEVTDEELQYDFPQVSIMAKYGVPATSLTGFTFLISAKIQGAYQSLFEWVEEGYLTVNELLRRTFCIAKRVYVLGKPKDKSQQLNLEW